MIRKLLLLFSLMLTLVLPALAAKKGLSDDAVHDAVMRKLAEDQVVKGGGLDVDVTDGVATIKGAVEYDNQKARAEKIAKKVNGVKKVVNQITVRRPGVKQQ